MRVDWSKPESKRIQVVVRSRQVHIVKTVLTLLNINCTTHHITALYGYGTSS